MSRQMLVTQVLTAPLPGQKQVIKTTVLKFETIGESDKAFKALKAAEGQTVNGVRTSVLALY